MQMDSGWTRKQPVGHRRDRPVPDEARVTVDRVDKPQVAVDRVDKAQVVVDRVDKVQVAVDRVDGWERTGWTRHRWWWTGWTEQGSEDLVDVSLKPINSVWVTL